jgi:quercetin dioxygenase-like cupin family protein
MPGADGLSFLGTPCPTNFRLRTLTVPPGGVTDYQPAEWNDALVVVERGELEVECRSGARAHFSAGAIVVFAALPLRRLHNAGSGPLVLSALSRVRSVH